MGSRSFFLKQMGPFGLGAGQFHFLLALYRNDSVSQDSLTERMMVDKATTTRALKKLESEGYVRREKDPKDKRKHMVFLTEKGWDIRPDILEVLERWTSLLLRDFTDEEKDQLFEYLERLERNSGDSQ